MQVPNRFESIEDYRYGFNGMEKDDEVKGEGNSYSTEFRQYDPRIARWLSVDPISLSFESPYSSFRNNPIVYNDPKGDCPDCNGFTSPSGSLMYAANTHYLWNEMGDLLQSSTEIAHRISADGIDFHWNQKLDGYYSDTGDKYSNPNSRSYDGVFLGFAEIGKDIIDPETYKQALVSTVEVVFAGMLGGDTATDLDIGISKEDYSNTYSKVKNADGTEVSKVVTKVVYGILISRTLNKISKSSNSSPQPNVSDPSFDELFDEYYNLEVDVYHKGNLSQGNVSVGRSLSTGTDLNSVSALNRDGIIHKFSIPKSVYDDWKSKGLIETITDTDFETGVVNSELRFDPKISGELNKYKTYGTNGTGE
jgi:RHS repeat-associated protein